MKIIPNIKAPIIGQIYDLEYYDLKGYTFIGMHHNNRYLFEFKNKGNIATISIPIDETKFLKTLKLVT